MKRVQTEFPEAYNVVNFPFRVRRHLLRDDLVVYVSDDGRTKRVVPAWVALGYLP